jgi:hypothetical protein
MMFYVPDMVYNGRLNARIFLAIFDIVKISLIQVLLLRKLTDLLPYFYKHDLQSLLSKLCTY